MTVSLLENLSQLLFIRIPTLLLYFRQGITPNLKVLKVETYDNKEMAQMQFKLKQNYTIAPRHPELLKQLLQNSTLYYYF